MQLSAQGQGQDDKSLTSLLPHILSEGSFYYVMFSDIPGEQRFILSAADRSVNYCWLLEQSNNE